MRGLASKPRESSRLPRGGIHAPLRGRSLHRATTLTQGTFGQARELPSARQVMPPGTRKPCRLPARGGTGNLDLSGVNRGEPCSTDVERNLLLIKVRNRSQVPQPCRVGVDLLPILGRRGTSFLSVSCNGGSRYPLPVTAGAVTHLLTVKGSEAQAELPWSRSDEAKPRPHPPYPPSPGGPYIM